MLSSIRCLPENTRLKEQTKTPLSLGKRRRFRDDGEAKHSTSPAGRGALGGLLNPRLQEDKSQPALGEG